jgi:hypothetical protein
VKSDEEQGSERTCVGTRVKAHPSRLERFVLFGDELVWDMRQRAPGRGVYVSPTPEALTAAVKRGGFARGFKRKVETPSAEELIEQVREGVARRLSERVQVCVRAREVAIGSVALKEGMKEGWVGVVLIASDAGASTGKKFEENARRKGLVVCRDLDGARLGELSGRDFVSVLGLKGGDRASAVVRDLEVLRGFGAI